MDYFTTLLLIFSAITLCAKGCEDDFVKNIEIVSCTNGSAINSTCTVKCKEGFLPAPHLFDSHLLPPEFANVSASLPEFMTQCSTGWEPGVGYWRPGVQEENSTPYAHYLLLPLDNAEDRSPVLYSFSLFEDPPVLFACFDLETALQICVHGYEAQVLGRTISGDCPYSIEYLLKLFDEETDGTGVPTSPPTPAPFQEQDLEDLNERERNSIRRFLRPKKWASMVEGGCPEASRVREKFLGILGKSIIPEERLEKHENLNWKKLRNIRKGMNDMFVELCTRKVDCPSCRPQDCHSYCLLPSGMDKQTPCGNFPTAKEKLSCLMCRNGKAYGCVKQKVLS